CCRTYQGGYVETPSCRMRWDLYMFFTPTADTVRLTLSSPPPSASPPDATNKTSETIKDNKSGISSGTIAIIVVPIIVFVAIVAFICILLRKRKNSKQEMHDKEDGLESLDSLQFQLKSVTKATDNFSQDNMLGQGGFGAVYKAWRNWREGTSLNVVDEYLRGGSGSRSEMTRSIHIGLLCVQESDANRPSMNSVVLMLSDASVSMPMPSTPAFMVSAATVPSEASSSSDYNHSHQFSRNKVTISTLDPR
ncbi:hypothetical protein V6N12_018647, partial [Hibiscus sabdariffa]